MPGRCSLLLTSTKALARRASWATTPATSHSSPVLRSPIAAVMSKPNVVFVLGAPGSGKGTQCMKIVREFGYVHLSAGDLLRQERDSPGSEFGQLIDKHIVDGTIVPVAITVSLLLRDIKKSGKTHFLIDGFPRNQDNLQGWHQIVGDEVNLKFVLFFACDEATCVSRCLGRASAGSARNDDNENTLKKRFVTFTNETMPIVEHFRALGLVREVDSAQPVDRVYSEVQQLFRD